MTTITYLTGDATRPQGDDPKVITHVCNDVGAWGAGFVLALSLRWPEPELAYLRWHKIRTPDFGLGRVQYVSVNRTTTVANMVAQRGLGSRRSPLSYDALEECLADVAQYCTDGPDGVWASVHMPRIGCGLAGGSWDKVESIIRRQLCDRRIPVTVYDLPDAP